MKISPSRIKAFTTCQRRYAWSYLHGEREPFAQSAQAGTEVHALLENNVFTGEELWPASVTASKRYQTGRMAAALREATPLGVVHREQALDVELDGILFTARVDFQTETLVGDYKTTSKSKYVKAVAELEDDPQRLLYTRMTERADALWLYGVWEGFKIAPVVVPGDAKRDSERFKLHVIQPSEELLCITADVDPLTLPANTYSCGLYPPHGCQFANRCYSVSGQLVNKSASTKENEMSIYVPGYAPEVVAPSPLEHENAIVPAPTSEKLIGTLYVDAYPVSGVDSVQHAGEIIARASESVRSDAHVLHSQLVEFGKGAHMLAAQLTHDIKSAGVRYEHVYLETRSAEGKSCLFELTQLSERVVRGMI